MPSDKDLKEKEGYLKTQIKVQNKATQSAIASKNVRTSKAALKKQRGLINDIEVIAITRLTAKEGQPSYDADMTEFALE